MAREIEIELVSEEDASFLPEDQSEYGQIVEKKPSIWYIIVPLFALSFSYAASIAPSVEAISLMFCYKYYSSQNVGDSDIPWAECNIPEVQALVSQAQAVVIFLIYGSSLLLTSYYGALSDRKGRRYVLKISILGSVIQYSALILTFKYFSTFDIYLLYAACVVRGLLAGDSVLIATANAYLTDCTTPSNRTLAYSYFASAMSLGAAIGPSVSSFIIKQAGSVFASFYLITAIQIFLGVYFIFFLPESIDVTKYKEGPKKTLLQRINIFSAFGVFLRPTRQHVNRSTLPILAAVRVLLTMCALPPTLLYAMLKFNWTAYESGLFMSVSSTVNVFTLLVILPAITNLFYKMMPLSNHLPSKYNGYSKINSSFTSNEGEEQKSEQKARYSVLLDIKLIRMGLFIKTISFIALGLVNTSTGFTLVGALENVSSLSSPSMGSLISSLVDPAHTGELWGALATLEALSLITSQFLINYIYSLTVSTIPAFTFFLCAGFVGIAVVLAFFIYPIKKESDQEL